MLLEYCITLNNVLELRRWLDFVGLTVVSLFVTESFLTISGVKLIVGGAVVGACVLQVYVSKKGIDKALQTGSFTKTQVANVNGKFTKLFRVGGGCIVCMAAGGQWARGCAPPLALLALAASSARCHRSRAR